MKEFLLELVERLEQQRLLLIQIADRVDALEQAVDHANSQAARIRVQALQTAIHASDGERTAYLSLHEDLRIQISKLPD